jgi:CheY-like chemotaxis protein
MHASANCRHIRSSREQDFLMTPPQFQILVVEDDKSSRHLICEMLELLGHAAHSVSNAEEAVELLRSGRRFHVLLADISLPGMSGIALAEIAVKSMPSIKVIFASGFGYLVTDKTDFDFMLLPKPYGFEQLKHALEHVCS